MPVMPFVHDFAVFPQDQARIGSHDRLQKDVVGLMNGIPCTGLQGKVAHLRGTEPSGHGEHLDPFLEKTVHQGIDLIPEQGGFVSIRHKMRN